MEFHRGSPRCGTDGLLRTGLATLASPEGERERWSQIGRDFVNKHQISSPLYNGHGNNSLQDGSDPWGECCHVAAVGYRGAGGASVLAAGKP
ncbi:MAG: hypothetical protein RIS36_1683 [Pseudomonadota bacterium]|jgi:hypothetical protein